MSPLLKRAEEVEVEAEVVGGTAVVAVVPLWEAEVVEDWAVVVVPLWETDAEAEPPLRSAVAG